MRYRRGDVIGTAYAENIADETINDGLITVRSRDTMEEVKVNIDV